MFLILVILDLTSIACIYTCDIAFTLFFVIPSFLPWRVTSFCPLPAFWLLNPLMLRSHWESFFAISCFFISKCRYYVLLKAPSSQLMDIIVNLKVATRHQSCTRVARLAGRIGSGSWDPRVHWQSLMFFYHCEIECANTEWFRSTVFIRL